MSLTHLHHFLAMLLFAGFVSIAVGFLARNTTKRRVQYAVWTFLMFVVVSIAVAWIMYPLSR